MIPILQCGSCKYGPTLYWEVSVDVEGIGKMVCSQYPDEIPNYVEEATDPCPKFKEE